MFQHPFTCLIAGPTGSGKSSFCKKLVLSNCILPPPDEIYWFYTEWQPQLEKDICHKVQFIQGIPDNLDELMRRKCRKLFIFDDLMNEVSNSDTISKLFTRGSHHTDTSVACLVQNIFHQGRAMRNINLNSHYIVLFRNPRDIHQVSRMASQMYAKNKSRFMVDAYKKAVSKPHGYLVCDLHPRTNENERLKTDIFNRYTTCFVPDNVNK